MKKLCLVAPLLLAVGCGGSSGASNGYPSAPAGIGNPIGPGINGGSTMGLISAGLTWRYAVSGTVTADYLDNNNNKQTHSGVITNGEMTRVVTNVDVNGTQGLQMTDTLSYQLQGGTPVVEVTRRFVQQNSDNSISLIGAHGYTMDLQAAAAIPIVAGSFTANTNLSGSTVLNSYTTPLLGSNTVQTAFTVLGQESVPSTTSVPYTAWKTQSTSSDYWVIDGASDINNGVPLAPGFVLVSTVNRTSVDDWVPALGSSVKSHVTQSQSDQVVISYQITTDPTTKIQTITYVEQTLNKSQSLDMVLIAKS